MKRRHIAQAAGNFALITPVDPGVAGHAVTTVVSTKCYAPSVSKWDGTKVDGQCLEAVLGRTALCIGPYPVRARRTLGTAFAL